MNPSGNATPTRTMQSMSDKKVALVTGANKGLGFEIARQLAKLGITTVASARDLKKAQEAAAKLKSEGLDVHPVKLDVTNSADIAELPKFFQEHFGHLDILINNAGIADFDKEPTIEQFREIIETNLVGQYAVTYTLLPLLKSSPAGRIVNQSSMLGSLTLMSKGQGGSFLTAGYSASKAGLNMLSVALAQLLKGTRIKVNSAHPGWVKTDMGGSGANLEIPEGAKTAVRLATLPDDGPTGGFFHMDKVMPW